jgi:hypothetical protein
MELSGSRLKDLIQYIRILNNASLLGPDIFENCTNKSIIIGSFNEHFCLVYLRYGIEWQLWYKALKHEKRYFYVM